MYGGGGRNVGSGKGSICYFKNSTKESECENNISRELRNNQMLVGKTF